MAARLSKRSAWAASLLVTGVSAAGIALACQLPSSGSKLLLAAVGGPPLLVALLSGWRLHRRGELKERLAPRRGDITLGAVMAAGLYGLALLAHKLFTASGAMGEPWVARIYLQLGGPAVTTALPVALGLLAVGALEEVAWRGGVMGWLGEAHGLRNAWWMSAVLSALAYAPTVILLGSPFAGPNPVLAVGVLGGSLLWGAVSVWTGRVAPAAFSRAVLLWAVVEFPLWRM